MCECRGDGDANDGLLVQLLIDTANTCFRALSDNGFEELVGLNLHPGLYSSP